MKLLILKLVLSNLLWSAILWPVKAVGYLIALSSDECSKQLEMLLVESSRVKYFLNFETLLLAFISMAVGPNFLGYWVLAGALVDLWEVGYCEFIEEREKSV